MHNFTRSSKVALETSYGLALLAAKYKSPYNAVESLTVPGALIIAEKMLDIKSPPILKTITGSDTSVGRRIVDIWHRMLCRKL